MSYKLYFILPLLLALFQSTGIYANPDARGAGDFEKKFSETYNVNGSGSVRLENRYGEINVETWGQDRVQIDVTVRVTATNQEKANATFDRITINFTGGANRATATTSIGNNNGGTSFFGRVLRGDWSWDTSSDDFKVYYNVKLPASVSLETVAKYCDVRLPNLTGENTINVAYGDLVAGKLSGSNTADVSYGSIRADELGKSSSLRLRYSEATIRKAYNLRYDGRYSEGEIGTVDRLDVDAGYEDVEIERAREIICRGNYNDIEIRSVDVLDIDGSYSDYDIRLVNKSVKADSNYGDVEIDELGPNFEKVSINTRYADVRIGMPSGRGYDVDVSTKYGDISVTKSGSLNHKEEGSSESMRGKVPGSGSGMVNIVTSYGDVSLR